MTTPGGEGFPAGPDPNQDFMPIPRNRNTGGLGPDPDEFYVGRARVRGYGDPADAGDAYPRFEMVGSDGDDGFDEPVTGAPFGARNADPDEGYVSDDDLLDAAYRRRMDATRRTRAEGDFSDELFEDGPRSGQSSAADIRARIGGRNGLYADPGFYTRRRSLTNPVGSVAQRITAADYAGAVPAPGVLTGNNRIERGAQAQALNRDLREAGLPAWRRLPAAMRLFRESRPQGSELGRQSAFVRGRAEIGTYINTAWNRGGNWRERLRDRAVFIAGAAALGAVAWAATKAGFDIINTGQFGTPDIPAAGQDVFKGVGYSLNAAGELVGGIADKDFAPLGEALINNATWLEQVARGIGVTVLGANILARGWVLGRRLAEERIGPEGVERQRAQSAQAQADNRDRRVRAQQAREARREEGRRRGDQVRRRVRNAGGDLLMDDDTYEERVQVAAEGRQRAGRAIKRFFTAARIREARAARRRTR